MRRHHREYPTFSKLVTITDPRNLFAATQLDSEPVKNAAFHYSYNLTRHEGNGNGGGVNSGETRNYANGSGGDREGRYTGSKKDRAMDRHWMYSGVHSTKGHPAGGNKERPDLQLESKVSWSSALSRDRAPKFYSRQYSEPDRESNNSLVKTATMTSMRHNSLPGERLPSRYYGERPPAESPTNDRRPFEAKRRKKGICDDTDGSHYQRQFLRVLKKRF